MLINSQRLYGKDLFCNANLTKKEVMSNKMKNNLNPRNVVSNVEYVVI